MNRRELIREAQDSNTSAERVAELASDPDPGVRRAVARHAALDDVVLARLLCDDAWEVRAVAAHHARTPRDRALAVVTELARDADAARREIAARSPLAPVDLLEALARDSDPEVRSSAAKNPRTPPAVARELLMDPEPCVVLGALAHPAVSNDERRAFISEDLLGRFFDAHADGDHLFEALCERYLWDILERAFADPERFDETWQELVAEHFDLVQIPSRNAVLTAIHRDHWRPVIVRLAEEVRGGARKPT